MNFARAWIFNRHGLGSWRIKAKLLTKAEKQWFEQMLDTGLKRISSRNSQVFLRYLKCGTYEATADYFGLSRSCVNNHVAFVLGVFDRMQRYPKQIFSSSYKRRLRSKDYRIEEPP